MASLRQEQGAARILAEKIENKRLSQEKNFIASKTMQEVLPRIIEKVRLQASEQYLGKAAVFSPSVARFVQEGKNGGSHD